MFSMRWLTLGDSCCVLLRITGAEDWHRPQVEGLLAAGADLLAFETIPSIKEAKAVVELLAEFPDSSAWLSFSVRMRSTFQMAPPSQEAVEVAKQVGAAARRGSQLLLPNGGGAAPGLCQLSAEPRHELGGVPNSGWEYDSEQGWQAGGESSIWIPELSRRWVKQGAALIGGCCCISPAEIAELRKVLKGATTGRP
ncbi:hypothetical protein OJAV_G00037870 [Oryzias javanicus]|uniref:Hcy-binding domain-containing protein n=1 Tax=Oryzias javanicus TaxID=123683 RepID=A0A3S2PRL5_ORYJA|nr:hypothetical protein OJAV_G00037870 [Oryzias javanicus]